MFSKIFTTVEVHSTVIFPLHSVSVLKKITMIPKYCYFSSQIRFIKSYINDCIKITHINLYLWKINNYYYYYWLTGDFVVTWYGYVTVIKYGPIGSLIHRQRD